MKSIQQLTMSNVKGVTNLFALGPLTVISGPNECGKSALLDAITINLLRYHPALGKTPASTMELSSDSRMAVSIMFSDGSMRNAEWKINSKGVVVATVPPAVIDDYAVDISTFHALKSADQLATLFERCKVGPEMWSRFTQSLKSGDMKTDCIVEQCVIQMEIPPAERIAATVDRISQQRNAARSAARAATVALQTWDETASTATVAINLITDAEIDTAEANHIRHSHHMTSLLTEKTGIENAMKQREATVSLLKSQWEAATKKWTDLRGMIVPSTLIQIQWTDDDEKQLIEQIRCQAESDATIKKLTAEESRIRTQIGLVVTGTDGTFVCPTCDSIIPTKGKRDQLEGFLLSIQESAVSAEEAAIEAENNIKGLRANKIRAAKCEKEAADMAANTARMVAAAQANKDACERYDQAVSELPANSLDAITAKIAAATADLDLSTKQFSAAQARMATRREIELQSKLRQEKVGDSSRLSSVAESLGRVCAAATTMMKTLADEAVVELFTVGNSIWSLFDQSLLGIEDGKIGFRREGKFHAWGCMSGRQKLIATIGIQVALSTGEGRGILLIDEIGRLDSESTTMLLHRLETLIAEGKIVQAIVVSPNNITAPESATVINL